MRLSSTSVSNSGMSSVRRIYRKIVFLLSPTSSAITLDDFTPCNLFPSGEQVKSVRCPCLFMASRRILYENAFSLGRIVERCKFDSTIKIIASSRVISRTSAFTVSSPASSQAFFLRWPDTISYRPSSFGRSVTGVIIPRSLML